MYVKRSISDHYSRSRLRCDTFLYMRYLICFVNQGRRVLCLRRQTGAEEVSEADKCQGAVVGGFHDLLAKISRFIELKIGIATNHPRSLAIKNKLPPIRVRVVKI